MELVLGLKLDNASSASQPACTKHPAEDTVCICYVYGRALLKIYCPLPSQST